MSSEIFADLHESRGMPFRRPSTGGLGMAPAGTKAIRTHQNGRILSLQPVTGPGHFNGGVLALE